MLVDSPIRLVDSNGPVQLETNEQFLPCGPGADKAKLVVDANPGSKFTVFWTGGDSLVRPESDALVGNSRLNSLSGRTRLDLS